MKKHLFALGGVVTLALVITGCSSVKWEGVSYLSPATEVNLKANPGVKIVALGNQEMLNPLVAAITNEFAKSGQFKMDAENPDYWLVFNGEAGFRSDDANAARFNKKITKVKSENAGGGYEYLTSADHNSSASTQFLSVAVYSVKDLAPVHYFDVALYDADFKSGAVRDAKAYNALFTKQIIAKIKDAFLTQKRTVKTAVPKAADSAMVKALLNGDASGVITRAKAVIPAEFDKVIADAKAGKYKENEEALEEMLCNYYVLALAKEINNFAPANLQELHRQHVAILNYAKEDALTEAVPNSLARIESKLKLLQALK